MRLVSKRLGLGVGALVTVAAVVVVSGVIPVWASSGHWPTTRWFLSFAMSRSVATHSLGIEAPALDDPALVVKGAGHYETGCAPCHGRPGGGRWEVAQETAPHPPVLAEVVSQWSAAELHQIVRHGVKFTGMPAWPVRGRRDEVWAVVAFLRVLPKLEERDYLTLAYGDLAPGQGTDSQRLGTRAGPVSLDGTGDIEAMVTRSCGRCHGTEGRGRGWGAFPSLAGQRRQYLINSLEAYWTGDRPSGIMHPVATGLEPGLAADLATYFASMGDGDRLLTVSPDPSRLPGRLPSPGVPETVSVERGSTIAAEGLPRMEIPSCVSCHGPGGAPRNPAFPILAGQYFGYLVGQLRLFHQEARGGSAYWNLMHAAVRELEESELLDVAAYYASLGATSMR